MANNDTSNRGLGSDNMDEQTKREIQSKGGKASANSRKGSSGSVSSSRNGGRNSQKNQ